MTFAPGDRFDRLTIIAEAEPTERGQRQYLCECSCGSGKLTIAVASNLRRNIWRSCGCLRAEAARENGKKHIQSTKQITYRGETLTLAEWAKRYDLTKTALSERLAAEWDLDRAMLTPLKKRRSEDG